MTAPAQPDPAIRPGEEAARLAALHRLDILGSDPEPGFDDIAALARGIAGTGTAFVSLIDGERQWFKARAGSELDGAPRSAALCDHAIRARATMVVLDAADDPRFRDDPFVAGPPGLRFYAGAPIISPDGRAIGTVCVIDSRPRERFDAADALEALARQAAAQIELRRLALSGDAVRAAASRDLDRLWTLAHDLIFVCDLDGGVLDANPAWRDVFGPLSADRSTRMRQFLADPTAASPLADIADGTATTVGRDYRDRHGAARSISWTLCRDGALVYGIGRDDTALRSAQTALIQARKMESIGQLTGGIAHDFNNLLTIVIGNLDIAARRLGRGDLARAERAIGDAGEGAARAATLTQRLLAFARRQRLAPRAIDPALLLADIRPLIERTAGETVAVDIIVEQGVWPIEIDVNQLENAILNLTVNARDAMAGLEEGGVITISAGNARVDQGVAAREGTAHGDFVRVSVADCGVGMADEVLERAFEPFFTTKGTGRGTGLGLSQVDGFVRQSGGFVTLTTEPGEGTIAHVWLPRTRLDPAPPPQSPVIPPAPTGVPVPMHGTSVMVVEDNDALRELVVETLRDAGFRVVESHDGRSALALFARQAAAPDLVISDVRMPRLDGFALAEEIRRRSPRTRILLMSGYAGSDSARASADVALLKPFTPESLLARVREALTTGG